MLGSALALLLPLVAPGEPLSLPALDFEVAAPGPDWAWTTLEAEPFAEREFVCEQAATGARISLMVFEGRFRHSSPEELAQFEADLAKFWEAQALRVADVRLSRKPLGTIPADYFRYRLTAEDETVLHVFRYAGVAERLYVLEALSSSEEEPEALTTIASSFRLLAPEAQERTESFDPAVSFGLMLSFLYAVFVFVCGMVGATANTFFGRRWNGWRVGVYGVAALAVVSAVVFAIRVPENMPPYRQGELFGSMVIGPVFWPVVLGGFFWWRFHRKNQH